MLAIKVTMGYSLILVYYSVKIWQTQENSRNSSTKIKSCKYHSVNLNNNCTFKDIVMILFKNNLINLLILQSTLLNCGWTNTMQKKRGRYNQIIAFWYVLGHSLSQFHWVWKLALFSKMYLKMRLTVGF